MWRDKRASREFLTTAAAATALAPRRGGPLVGVILLAVLVVTVARSVAADAVGLELHNAKLSVRISSTGTLLAVENRLAGETYAFAADGFALDTDLGTLASADGQPVLVQAAQDRLVYQWDFERLGDRGTDSVRVTLSYTLGPDNGFFRRTLKITNSGPLRLNGVRLGSTSFQTPAEETIHYLTFWMAPTVEFIRFRRGGMFTGIENPFYRAELTERAVALSYEPGLILKAGEGYESEPQFIGVYESPG